MKNYITFLLLGFFWTLSAQPHSQSITLGIATYNNYSVIINQATTSTAITTTHFTFSNVPIVNQNTTVGTACNYVPNVTRLNASSVKTLSFTLSDQNTSFPFGGTYNVNATGCKLLSATLYDRLIIPYNHSAQNGGNITATFGPTNVTLNGTLNFGVAGIVTFNNVVLLYNRCANSQPCSPNSFPSSLTISEPSLPITYDNIVGKWKEIDYWENGIRKMSFLANTFQQCLSSASNQGFYIFNKFEKPEYKYLGIVRREYFDGIPVKKILFSEEELPSRGRLMSNYIKNNILYYFEAENCSYKELKLEVGDFVKVIEDNGCQASGLFHKKGLYVYDGTTFVFHSVNTPYNPCNKILTYGSQKSTFSDNNSHFKIESGGLQTRLTGDYTGTIGSYPPFYLNNSRRSLPSDTNLNVSILTQNYMEIEYTNNLGLGVKIRFKRIP